MNREWELSTKALILAQQEYLQAIEARQVVPFPPARRALMIGPHPDDIVLGCGGTVLKYVAQSVSVSFLCLTDGRACVADARERERLVLVRAAEERDAARSCGVGDVEFLGFPEDRFTLPESAAPILERLVASLVARAPDAVFVPYFLEVHPQHRYTNHLLAAALERYGGTITVYVYEVLSLVPPVFVVDISRELERKKDIVRLYRSQLSLRDYVKDLELIGALHAPLAGPGARAAEVFQAFAAGDYVARVRGLAIAEPETLACGVQPVVPEG
ncbi:MAG: PIG-L deacetylase family protein [Planctomycetota bacterium]